MVRWEINEKKELISLIDLNVNGDVEINFPVHILRTSYYCIIISPMDLKGNKYYWNVVVGHTVSSKSGNSRTLTDAKISSLEALKILLKNYIDDATDEYENIVASIDYLVS